MSPDEEFDRELWVYSTQEIYELQVLGLSEHMHRRKVSKDWLVLSICPLDCGWKPEDRLTIVPSAAQKAFHSTNTNWGSKHLVDQGVSCLLGRG